ncbi:peroxidase 44-like [Gastrolobium bilobum]|uniref:peroxidase 44-like n=1 Tax=Gastrolobium bilobum TaxID=150636 RepID=UPI002AAF5014|nr:peroxidase 44-like [Gastrolobium bilobum]
MKFAILTFFFVLPIAFAKLEIGFYAPTCPTAEEIVHQVVQRNFKSQKNITGALLRMHFHDCFVRGCDASILIDPTEGNKSEKDAPANKSVRGYELIDEIKKALEKECPSTVSCADIITLATRDVVAMAGGPRYSVLTGRRDGLVSNSSEVNILGPDSTVPEALKSFVEKNMTLSEMITLLGAHTVGSAHCNFIQTRLSILPIDPVLHAKLMQICGPANTSKDHTVFLDQNTSFVFDNEFYNQILLKRGVLFIDQQLALDPSSSGLVSTLAQNDADFQQSFADAIIKMGSIDVLVGKDGEIRKNCRVFNSG